MIDKQWRKKNIICIDQASWTAKLSLCCSRLTTYFTYFPTLLTVLAYSIKYNLVKTSQSDIIKSTLERTLKLKYGWKKQHKWSKKNYWLNFTFFLSQILFFLKWIHFTSNFIHFSLPFSLDSKSRVMSTMYYIGQGKLSPGRWGWMADRLLQPDVFFCRSWRRRGKRGKEREREIS